MIKSAVFECGNRTCPTLIQAASERKARELERCMHNGDLLCPICGSDMILSSACGLCVGQGVK